MHDGIDSRRKKEVKRRECFPYDEPEGSDDLRWNSSSVCEAERRSLFHSIHDSAYFSTSIEHLCQEAERGR